MIESVLCYDVSNRLIINNKVREWCKKPYPQHPKGCPNYDEKLECPPQAPWVADFIDLTQPHYLVVVKFNLQAHVDKIKLRPRKDGKAWTEKQARCVLYWQNTVRKTLHAYCKDFVDMIYTLIPEAMGVNVISTARHLRIPITRKITDTVYKIALIGHPKWSKNV